MSNENLQPEPISPGRYLLGTVLLLGYHSAVGTGLEMVALCNHRYRPVARFHRQYTLDVLGGVLKRRDIEIDRQLGFETGLERRGLVQEETRTPSGPLGRIKRFLKRR